MKRIRFFLFVILIVPVAVFGQSDTVVIRDIQWDKNAPAGSVELFIPSDNGTLAGFIYKANGPQKHPTLILLHGFPGNERNLDLAQVARSRGWNVIYFDYRGSWGSQGRFSFKNCVDDAVNVVAFCKKYRDSLRIDTSNIALFGHSMGGWVCLQALQRLPGIKKGFALSTWDIYNDMKDLKTQAELEAKLKKETGDGYFVLNTPNMDIHKVVFLDLEYYKLDKNPQSLAGKQIMMVDEHTRNKPLADNLKLYNKTFFNYQVWQTDHSFTNRRASLINTVMAFLNK